MAIKGRARDRPSSDGRASGGAAQASIVARKSHRRHALRSSVVARLSIALLELLLHAACCASQVRCGSPRRCDLGGTTLGLFAAAPAAPMFW
jgi:hypothetical protein